MYKNNHIEGMMMLMTTTTMIDVKPCDFAATVRISVRWPCGHCIPTLTNCENDVDKGDDDDDGDDDDSDKWTQPCQSMELWLV